MKRLAAVALLSCLALLPACQEGDAEMSGGAGDGQLTVSFVDAPLDLSTVESVIVTVDAVTVYPAALQDGTEVAPIQVTGAPATFDLLTLTDGAKEVVAQAMLPAGIYQRIRFDVPEATLTFLDGTVEPLKIESEKVDVPIAFELSAGENMEIVLDFQADASVHVTETATDRYILRPVVTPVP
jgi:hypothetical protein